MKFKGGFTNGPGPKCHDPGPRFSVPWQDSTIRDVLKVRTVKSKEDLTLFSCSDFSFLDSSGLKEIYAVTFDADCARVGSLKSVIAHLRELELAFIVYTSFSHRLQKERHTGEVGAWDCFRVILPLSQPIADKSEYKKLYSAVLSNDLLPANDAWDKTARMMARGWYEPGTTSELMKHALLEVGMGTALEVDYLVSSGEPAKTTAKHDEEPKSSRMQKLLDAFADKLAKAGYPLETVDLESENRGHCPACKKNHDPSLSVRTEGRKILATCYRGCTIQEILGAINGTAADIFAGPLEELEHCIQIAFNNGRTEPYTVEELSAMAPLERRWILQAPGGYFIRAPGGDYIGPVVRDHVVNLARDLLAPAISADVSVYAATKKGGMKLKSLGELLHEYGRTMPRMGYSYCTDRTQIDGSTLVRRTAIAEEFEPEFNEQIAEWLELLAGPQHEAVLDWLATLLDLSRPTCAICISGASGAGKDLFLAGIARLWGGRYMSFQRALAKHNDGLLNTPIIFANETLVGSGDYQWNPVEALKTLISDMERSIEPKNQQAVQLRGCSRVVMATNKRGAFNLGRQPTQSDIQALDERILLLRPGNEARDFLIKIGGMETTTHWADGGGIARHITWLKQNRRVAYGNRFIVQGRGGMSDLLSADGKGSAVVLRALLKALTGRNHDKRVITIHQDDAWFSLNNLREKWSVYEKADLPDDMGEVVRTITTGDRKPIRVGGQLVRMARLQVSILEEAAAREEMLDDLEAAFGLSEDTSET